MITTFLNILLFSAHFLFLFFVDSPFTHSFRIRFHFLIDIAMTLCVVSFVCDENYFLPFESLSAFFLISGQKREKSFIYFI